MRGGNLWQRREDSHLDWGSVGVRRRVEHLEPTFPLLPVRGVRDLVAHRANCPVANVAGELREARREWQGSVE